MSQALFNRGKLIVPVLLVGFIPFLVATKNAWSELRYSMSSSVTSTVNVREANQFRMSFFGIRLWNQIEVGYEYTDAEGEFVRGRDVTAVDWAPPESGVEVQYFPGTDYSRLAGNRNVKSIIYFLVYLVLAGGTIAMVWQIASKEVNAPRPRRH